ncbi:tetratricopeptide repeat protein [Rhizobium calliandrae]|uniref:Tetratricopeptide repeat protein n=1 Tax=Rhizobium calliandrae TaxID=1312182 RepID=A0ABT7KJZ0_9HYPH|nr:tetratricopeptide repeat protein [Rhizobium calliandrae]MDL2408877.1 tetratricopeptide repeat protein [Rhizobium calliandrae]
MILLEHRLAAAVKHRTEGRGENALAIYQEILDISPANREALKGLGEVLLELGRIEDSVRIATQAVALLPSDLEALTLLAVAARASGNAAGEVLALDQAADIDPRHPATACMRAEKVLAAGDMAGSERILVNALRRHPEDAKLLSALSRTYMAAGLTADALELSLKAVKIDPRSSAHRVQLGSQLAAVGYHVAALEQLEQASLIDPANLLPMILMAEAHAALGQLTEGLRIAKRAIGLHPEQLAAWRIHARIRIQQGEVTEALAELADAARRHKDRVEALIAVGDAYRQAGQHAQSIRLLEPLKEQHSAVDLSHRQAILAITRESRLSLGMIEETSSLMQEIGIGGLQPGGAPAGPQDDARPGAGLSADWAQLAALPTLIGQHMSMLEALPLLRFRVTSDPSEPLSLRGPTAFAELAALLPGTTFRSVEGDHPIPGVDGFPLPAILALPTKVRGPIETGPYVVAPEDRRPVWRESLAHLPRPWLALSWNASRPGLILDDLLPLFSDFTGSLISVIWDESRHQLAQAPHIIDAGVHFESLGDLAAVLAEVDALVGPDGVALHLAGAMHRRSAVLVQPNAPWYWCERDGRALWYRSVSVLKTGAIGHWAQRCGELKTGLIEFLADLPGDRDDRPVKAVQTDRALPTPLEEAL